MSRSVSATTRRAECHPERRHAAHGLCHGCAANRYRAERALRDPEYRERQRVAALTRNRRHQLRRNGWTQALFDARMREQQGRCAVCGSAPDAGSVLDCDHDHRTGAPRGLLCRACNQALGLLGDNAERVSALLAYLGNY